MLVLETQGVSPTSQKKERLIRKYIDIKIMYDDLIKQNISRL